VAWWLAYEELYGEMDKEYPIMSDNDTIGIGTDAIGAADTVAFNFNEGGGEDVVIFGGDSSDTISIYGAQDFNYGSKSAFGTDTITFSSSTLAGAVGSDTINFKIKGAGDYFSDLNAPYPYPADHPSQDFWKEDGFSLTGNPGAMASDTIKLTDDSYPTLGAVAGSRVKGGMGEDHISLNPYPTKPFTKVPEPSLNKPGVHKYEEDKGIKDLKDYVASTYSGHYTTKGSNVQTLDLIESVGDAESFCRSNAIKYLSRYDKKGQAKRDILKALDYTLLLYYFSGNTQNDEITTRGYETF